MKVIKTLVVMLGCLIVLFISGCGLLQPAQPATPTLFAPTHTPVSITSIPTSTAPIVPSTTPTIQTVVPLREALAKIHDQFKIDSSKGCYEIPQPYPEYQKALQNMTALVLNDPRAQSLSLAEREVLFSHVTGFGGVRFVAGSKTATLVSLPTNRGHNLGCGSHSRSPDALYVVDQQNNIYDIDSRGLLGQAWWVNDRWIAIVKLKLDSTSGPTPWVVIQAGQSNGKWQRLVNFEFVPTPYNFATPPPLRFENGYQTMIADLDYWWANDPCEFTATFKNTYAHGDWKMRRTFQLSGDTYKLTSSEVLTFTVQRKDTGAAIALNWQSYCAGPIK